MNLIVGLRRIFFQDRHSSGGCGRNPASFRLQLCVFLIETLATNRSNQSLNEGMRQGDIGKGLEVPLRRTSYIGVPLMKPSRLSRPANYGDATSSRPDV